MGRQRGKYYIRNQAGVFLCCTVRPVFAHRQKKGEEDCQNFKFASEMICCELVFPCTFGPRLYFGLD